MQAKLPALFGTLPKAPFEVVAIPDYLEKTAPPAYYEAGTPDGSRPGRLFINTYDAEGPQPLRVEAIAYHEGIPGHHLQISIAQELKGFRSSANTSGYTAYVEGWGLYAERLGKDAGFYQDPYSDYGRLENDIWRAIRLVVDTGVHSQHWTRDQMVEYFHDHSARRDHDSIRGRPLYCVAGTGAGLQDRPIEDSGAAGPGAEGAGRQVRSARLSR